MMKGNESSSSSMCTVLRRKKVRCNRKFVLFLILFIPSFAYFNFRFNWPVFHVFRNNNVMSPCVIPKYDPYDPSIAKFFWHSDPINCEKWLNLVYVDSNGFLRVNDTAVSLSGLTGIKCGYSPIKHLNDTAFDFTKEVRYDLPSFMHTEFFRVQCMDKSGKLIYDYVHYNLNYEDRTKDVNYKEESEDQLSVYIFGLDSVSKLLAERMLKKTNKYMREELGAYKLNGYTKIGDNSFPNLLAFLTGRKAYTPESTFPSIGHFPFIWKNFTAKGYVDMFIEDWPEIATFNGFDPQPTHHYLRTFLNAMHKFKPTKRSMDKILLFLEHRNIKLKDTSALCYGNIPKHLLIMNYYLDFIERYGKKLKFSFLWLNELTHDLINFVELIDNDLLSFLKRLKDSGRLQNSVFILFSDHGPRYSEIQNTEIGRVTDLMPMASIVLPPHFRQKHPHLHKTLTINSNRLTTHYDMYETLKDILQQNFAPQEAFTEKSPIPRGISLFREVPERRSCYNAEIPENYCPCYSTRNMSVKHPRIRDVAQFLVDDMNRILDNSVPGKCAKLKLAEIQSAHEVTANLQRAPEQEEYFSLRSYLYQDDGGSARYVVVIETTPCGGLFEGTVEYGRKKKILGQINRVNRYGDQSKCVTGRLERLYCCCT